MRMRRADWSLVWTDIPPILKNEYQQRHETWIYYLSYRVHLGRTFHTTEIFRFFMYGCHQHGPGRLRSYVLSAHWLGGNYFWDVVIDHVLWNSVCNRTRASQMCEVSLAVSTNSMNELCVFYYLARGFSIWYDVLAADGSKPTQGSEIQLALKSIKQSQF